MARGGSHLEPVVWVSQEERRELVAAVDYGRTVESFSRSLESLVDAELQALVTRDKLIGVAA